MTAGRTIDKQGFLSYLLNEVGLDSGKDNPKRYLRVFERVLADLGNRPFTKETIRDYLGELRDKGYKPKYIENLRNMLKHIDHYMNYGVIDAMKFRSTPSTPSDHFILTEAQIMVILRTPSIKKGKPHPQETNRYSVAILFMYLYALRISELCELTWDDVQPDRLRLRDTKASADQYMAIIPQTLDLLKKLNIYEHNYIFGYKTGRLKPGTLAKELRDRAQRANIPNFKRIHNHTLRHSRLTHLAESTGDIAAVQQVARHKDPKITAQYIHFGMNKMLQTLQEGAIVQGSEMDSFEKGRETLLKTYDRLAKSRYSAICYNFEHYVIVAYCDVYKNYTPLHII